MTASLHMPIDPIDRDRHRLKYRERLHAAERYVKSLVARDSGTGSLLARAVTQDAAGRVQPSYAWDPAPMEELEAHHRGRTVRFTDHRDRDDADIIAA